MSKSAVTSAFLAALVLVVGLWYVKQGDFNDLSPKKVTHNEQQLIGRYYEGQVDDKALTALMDTMYKQSITGEYTGEMVVYYFGDPDTTSSDIKVFVGIDYELLPQPLPEGLEELQIETYKSVFVDVDPSDMFSPNPQNVNKTLREYAIKEGLKSRNIYIEKYLKSGEVRNELAVE
ncbi:hypothetical protein [Algivirga pacifica]|uniref:GyrI-like small molecule binding domain-containing protein n=1 Tax=Algivirga pacifica TaxID=1162670 RepID=A0ABP9DGG0_9BACT